jgi:hypothetical protein
MTQSVKSGHFTSGMGFRFLCFSARSLYIQIGALFAREKWWG